MRWCVVSCLLAGMEQASGPVDVPDSTKIESAAASPGTSRFQAWNTDALGEVQSRRDKNPFPGEEGTMAW